MKIPASLSKAVLTADQIRAFCCALRAYRGYPETAMCLRLIAFTACRPGEAADAEWVEFDIEAKLWRRPAAKMKARRDHVSPLSAQALQLPEQLRPITGTGQYLFPHRSGQGFTTPNRLTYAMRDMSLGERTTPPPTVGARPSRRGPMNRGSGRMPLNASSPTSKATRFEPLTTRLCC